MSDIIFEPTSPNWQVLHERLIKAASYDEKAYIPIPPQTIPVLAEHRVLAVMTYSEKASSRWRVGGWLTIILDCGGADFVDADVQKYTIPLNRAQLVILPRLASAYKLRFEAPYWFEEIKIVIYQYVGEVTDRLDLAWR